MEEEEETSSGKFEWSGSFNPITYELENIADNTEYDYTGNEAFEIMDFESEIQVVYDQGDAPSGGGLGLTFSPDFSTYSFVLERLFFSNGATCKLSQLVIVSNKMSESL